MISRIEHVPVRPPLPRPFVIGRVARRGDGAGTRARGRRGEGEVIVRLRVRPPRIAQAPLAEDGRMAGPVAQSAGMHRALIPEYPVVLAPAAGSAEAHVV